jgi:hypothetical protein
MKCLTWQGDVDRQRQLLIKDGHPWMVGKRTCTTDNCVTPAHIEGYIEYLAAIAERSNKVPMIMCGVDYCPKPTKSLNLCTAHYLQHHRARRRDGCPKTKPTLEQLEAAILPKTTDGNCNVEGCHKPRHAGGICDTHYAQWSRKKKQQ